MLTLWGKIPALIRGPLIGILILLVTLQPVGIFIQLNLTYYRQAPWAILPSSLYLWLCWRYLAGDGPPSSTRVARHDLLRLNPITGERKVLVWIAATFLVFLISAFAILSYTVQELSPDSLGPIPTLFDLPPFTAVGLIMLVAMMSGITEEAAFRGYMQRTMEKRHHPALAILVTALMFALVHPQPLVFMIVFMVGSCAFGILAYLSRSIYPLIVVHALVDFAIILWLWLKPDSMQALLDMNVLATGINQFFLGWALVWAIALTGFIWATLKLWRLKPESN